ncbi:MAG: hypothetical protein WD971_08690 [Pirellulales bacterium]
MKSYLSAAAIALVLFSASAIPVRASIVAAGDDVILHDSTGSLGGIFQVDVLLKGTTTPPYDFDTFCVQTLEVIGFNTKYRVQTITKNTLGSYQNNVSLGSKAAWLYTGFLGVDGVSLAATGFNPTMVSHVNALQWGIWSDLGYALPSGFSFDPTIFAALNTAYGLDAVWAAQAPDINGNKTGNVNIMNLVQLNTDGTFKHHRQDQLTWSPGPLFPPPPAVPEPLSFVVWSLLAMCVGGISTQRGRNRS